MKNKIASICMITGVLLVLISTALLVYNYVENRQAKRRVNEVMPLLLEEMLPSNEDKSDMKEVEIQGQRYLGYLTIPILGLELPVMSDWSYTKLKSAPCRYAGSTNTDDIVIAAHNYSNHFGRIKNLSKGDRVYFTDMCGLTGEYEVVEIAVLTPNEVEEMTSGGYDLTLFTCNYSGQSRVTVRCDRVF